MGLVFLPSSCRTSSNDSAALTPRGTAWMAERGWDLRSWPRSRPLMAAAPSLTTTRRAGRASGSNCPSAQGDRKR